MSFPGNQPPWQSLNAMATSGARQTRRRISSERAVELFTLGYEKRTLESFLELLREAGIDAVIDVRDVPWSHKPGFFKGPLSEALPEAGIEYMHAGFAGNPKALRSAAQDNADALGRYEEHLRERPEIVAELDALLGPLHAAGKKACLICFERDPQDCHRGILARAWAKSRPAVVRHLGAEREP